MNTQKHDHGNCLEHCSEASHLSRNPGAFCLPFVTFSTYKVQFNYISVGMVTPCTSAGKATTHEYRRDLVYDSI